MLQQQHDHVERKEQREMRITRAALRQARRKRKPVMPRGWKERRNTRKCKHDRADQRLCRADDDHCDDK